MRPALLILFLQIICFSLPAQYYLTGEVRDRHGDKLQNVNITVSSTGSIYRSGLMGEFRIDSRVTDDSVTFALDGYLPYRTVIHSTGFLQVTLRSNGFDTTAGRILPAIMVRRLQGDSSTISFTGATPLASYSTIRRFLNMGTVVPPEAVRIEEMLNYFNFPYDEPDGDAVFRCGSSLLTCPWDPSHQLLFLKICARRANLAKKPPGNLVLLIDGSGSMDMPNKLPLIKSGIRLLIDNLRDIDTVSLVVYGGNTRVAFAGVSGAQKGEIMRAIEEIRPDGPSPGGDGLKLAYRVARKQFIPHGNNRVILLTDGDICSGPADAAELQDLVVLQDQAGIHLSCGGVGMASYKYSQLPLLAEAGKGNFAYLDDEDEVEQLLAGELDPGIGCVADDVSITAEFNSVLVKEYRLIGFDNRGRVSKDTASKLTGSRIGSGHSLLALFELTPKIDSTGADTVAGIRINYSLPGQHVVRSMNFYCPNDLVPFERAEPAMRRAACIALFGMKLQQSGYATRMDWGEVEKMARKAFTGTNWLDYEYITLVDKARKIYERR